ncbi:hypothetical protein F4808DRAFT_461958 [Astrocystis sublimbata]|nr:hypothetical protein F4808DRAFT_461958 [Astrocystis sublimbata]
MQFAKLFGSIMLLAGAALVAASPTIIKLEDLEERTQGQTRSIPPPSPGKMVIDEGDLVPE